MYDWYFQNLNNNDVNKYENTFYNVRRCNTAIPEADKTKQFGFLEVDVSTPNGAPKGNAVVTVYILDRFSGEAPVNIATTDSNGKSPILKVPTAYYLGKEVGPNNYFTAYNLRVDAIGYYSSQTNNVRFYPGVTTVFNIVLFPIPLGIPGVNLEQRIELPSPTPSER